MNLELATGPACRPAPSEPSDGRLCHYHSHRGWFPRMKLSPASSLLRSLFVERSHANTGAKKHTQSALLKLVMSQNIQDGENPAGGGTSDETQLGPASGAEPPSFVLS